MKMAFRIYDNLRDVYVEGDGEFLMRESGQDPRIRFEDIAVQSDGTLIVCDKCGNYDYLCPRRFELKIMSDK